MRDTDEVGSRQNTTHATLIAIMTPSRRYVSACPTCALALVTYTLTPSIGTKYDSVGLYGHSCAT